MDLMPCPGCSSTGCSSTAEVEDRITFRDSDGIPVEHIRTRCVACRRVYDGIATLRG